MEKRRLARTNSPRIDVKMNFNATNKQKYSQRLWNSKHKRKHNAVRSSIELSGTFVFTYCVIQTVYIFTLLFLLRSIAYKKIYPFALFLSSFVRFAYFFVVFMCIEQAEWIRMGATFCWSCNERPHVWTYFCSINQDDTECVRETWITSSIHICDTPVDE